MTSTGLLVNPASIHSYADVVGRQEAALTRIHAALARVNLPGDAFGKMPEAGTLHTAYTEHAADILEITARLPEQISGVARGLHSTARSYAELEANMARDIGELFGTGSGGAGAGQTLGIAATATGEAKQYYGWVSDPETALPPLIPDSLYGASGGISGLLDGGINFIIDHIHPLLEALDYVTGDSEALEAAAGAWHDQGNALNDVIRELKTSSGVLPEEWAGAASDQFGQFMGDVTTSLTEIVSVMGQTQKILDDAREQSEFAHDTIVMIIREVIEWFTANAAVDVLTLGAASVFEAAGMAAVLADKVRQAEEAESRLAGIYKALRSIIESLQDMKSGFKTVKGLERLKALRTMPEAFEETFEAGRLKNLRMLGNGKIAGIGKAVFGAGRHAKGIPQAMEIGVAGVLTTGAIRVGVAGGIAATGIESEPGLSGLAEGLIDGNLGELPAGSEGAAEAVGLGPEIPDAPSLKQVDATIKAPTPPEKPDGT